MIRSLLPYALWPATVLATTAAYAFGFDAGRPALTLIAVPFVLVPLLLVIELVLPADPIGPAWSDPQIWNDVGHGIFGQGVGVQLGQIFFVSGAALLAGAVSDRFGANLWPTALPEAVQGLLVIALADGLETLRHRLLHTSPRLWPLHALHHATDRLHAMKSGRGHFLDMMFRSLVVYAPLVVIGVPSAALFWYAAAVTVFVPIGHANVDVWVPAWMHPLVMTPQVHRIHHAGDLEIAMSNYANVFPLWDVLLGTFRHPAHTEQPTFGTPDDPMPSGFLAQLADPFRGRSGENAPVARPAEASST
jgi:sterol desaturase/sphingolipid hydroxylase (fatty acid hydroxylase superfamily)